MAAADQQVIVADLLRSLGQGVARGQSVRAAEGAVRQKGGFVAAHRQGLLQNVVRLRGTHAHGDYAAAVFLLQAQRRLHGVRVQRVHDALDALALQVAGLGVQLNVVRIRDLLYKYDYFHLFSLSDAYYFCARMVPPISMRRISFVPSPISSSFESRTKRSRWYSLL